MAGLLRLADQRHLLFLVRSLERGRGRGDVRRVYPPDALALPRMYRGRGENARPLFVCRAPIPSRGSPRSRGWISEDGKFSAIADPLTVLADRLGRFRWQPIEGLPPFQGGAAGLFGYDLCHHIEVLPRPQYDDFSIPDLAVGIYDWVIAFDHWTERAWLISTGYPESDPHAREQRAANAADQVKRWLDRAHGRALASRVARAAD